MGNAGAVPCDLPNVKISRKAWTGLSAALAATAMAATLVLASGPAQADPPIGVGLLDPNCLVSVVLNGQTVCLVYVSPTQTPPPPTTSTVPYTGTPTAST